MEEKNFSDYLHAFRRRKMAFFIIFALVVTISSLAALLLPPVYRSSSTILIEEQEIPTDLVRSTITSFAAQRLQTISQRVMTRSNLMAIIDKFNLYEKERKKDTTDEVVEQMRKDISFQTLSADVIDPRSGRPTQATIAFTLSYDGNKPDLVQKIANEITSLYLEENLRMRTRQTAEASDFLTQEVTQIGNYAMELEQKLAKFKEAHLNELPEHKQLTQQAIERTESEIKEIDFKLRGLQEHNYLIDSQLGHVPLDSPVNTPNGQQIISPSERLKGLRTQYVSLAAQYSDKHPDLVKARQEIEALEKEVGQVDPSIDQHKQLEALRTEKAAMAEKYADNHPDVTALDNRITALEKAIAIAKAAGHKPNTAEAEQYADNPAYLNLVAQKQANSVEASALNKRRAELQVKQDEYEKHIQNSPDIERQFFALLRDWENTTNRYRELKAKQMEAQIAEQLERKSKGERFSMVEPPLLPEKPIKPNRPAIFFIGLFLALASAAGFVILRESMDKSIRKIGQIADITGFPPLAVIPYIELEEEAKLRGKQTFLVILALAAGLIVALLLVHWLWTPLDVLWFKGLRKVDMMLG